MPISIAQFLERLQASELVSAKEVEALGARFPKSKRWQDADGLIRELIEAKTLTRFQAGHSRLGCRGGAGRPLR